MSTTDREEAARAALDRTFHRARANAQAQGNKELSVGKYAQERHDDEATILAEIEEGKRLREAAQSVAWSVILADHVGDVWGPMERLLEAAGLPAPIEDDEGCYVLPFPIDPRFPDDEAERYALARRALRGSDTEPKVSLWKGKA